MRAPSQTHSAWRVWEDKIERGGKDVWREEAFVLRRLSAQSMRMGLEWCPGGTRMTQQRTWPLSGKCFPHSGVFSSVSPRQIDNKVCQWPTGCQCRTIVRSDLSRRCTQRASRLHPCHHGMVRSAFNVQQDHLWLFRHNVETATNVTGLQYQ